MYVQNPKKKSYFFLSVDPDPQYYVGIRTIICLYWYRFVYIFKEKNLLIYK